MKKEELEKWIKKNENAIKQNEFVIKTAQEKKEIQSEIKSCLPEELEDELDLAEGRGWNKSRKYLITKLKEKGLIN